MNRSLRYICAAVLMFGSASVASAVELITNGDFELGGGSLAGWTVSNSGSGDFALTNAGIALSPISSSPVNTTGAAGSFAVTDQTGPGAHVLSQIFSVPGPVIALTLNFDFFINDASLAGPIVDPAGLVHATGPNQHSRVDILLAGASPFSTSPGDIVQTVALPLPQNNPGNPNPFAAFGSTDLTAAALLAGGTFQLRFGEVDNQLFYNLGIDNVSIRATTSVVPLPATLPLFLSALGLLGAAVRHRGSRSRPRPVV